jgi:hypothetical protein
VLLEAINTRSLYYRYGMGVAMRTYHALAEAFHRAREAGSRGIGGLVASQLVCKGNACPPALPALSVHF